MSQDWGEIIEKTLNQGREDRSSQYKKINQFDSRYEKFTHCSHVMIYARTDSEFETFPKKALILMQMRFDGYVGFPGGIVDNNETPQQAVNREVKEELGWSEEKEPISESDYQFTHVDEKKELVFHFYATEITEKKLLEIEQNSPKACDYGNEVLGNFRVPLYIMGDAFRGFPSFLRNHFSGNSKRQLIETIVNLKLLTEDAVILNERQFYDPKHKQSREIFGKNGPARGFKDFTQKNQEKGSSLDSDRNKRHMNGKFKVKKKIIKFLGRFYGEGAF